MRWMKALAVLALVLVLLLSTLGSAGAQQAGARRGLFGTVSALKLTGSTLTGITLDTKQGPAEVAITPQTKFKAPEGDIPLSEGIQGTQVGARLAITAQERDGALVALQVMLVPGKPSYTHQVGVVVKAEGNTLTLTDSEGKVRTVDFPQGLPQVAQGQMVTAVGQRTKAGEVVAKGLEKVEGVVERLQKDLARVEQAQPQTEEERQRKGKDLEKLRGLLEENASRHLSVLSQVLEKAPEQAKDAIRQAMENSSKGYQQALQAIGAQAARAKVEGVIEALDLGRGTVTISFQGQRQLTLKITTNTKVEVTGGLTLVPGFWVEATYDPVTLEAFSIQARAPERVEGREVVVQGTIDSIGLREWVIGGRALAVAKDTKIEGSPQVGLWAEATLLSQPDGSLVALKIQVLGEKGSLAEDRLEFAGPIQELGNVAWVIGGRTVAVAKDTKIEGTPQVGAWAEVRARVGPEGRLVALSIKIEAAQPGPALLRGVIQSLATNSWVVSGTTVALSADTRIEGTPQVGLVVEVKGEARPDGTFLAREISVQEVKALEGQGRAAFSGKVERISADLWVVAGVQVAITNATRIKGEPQVGDTVTVEAATQPNGTLVALRIEAQRPSPGGAQGGGGSSSGRGR